MWHPSAVLDMDMFNSDGRRIKSLIHQQYSITKYSVHKVVVRGRGKEKLHVASKATGMMIQPTVGLCSRIRNNFQII